MRGERLLVSVTYAEGEAAVLADEHGGLSLTGQLAGGPGTRITATTRRSKAPTTT